MQTARSCGKCGTTLNAYAPEGLCPTCMFLGGLEPDSDRVEEAGADIQNPSGDVRAGRVLGDYELLEEIARGGMGVVFKARQKGLNRIVAIKVVRAGGLAGVVEMERFRAEARAVAGLQHPNIVAIHEVGEFDGQPFFSMDFIQGRNLDELVRDIPLPAMRAARYIKTIAEAIHYAHGKGILHRDLKPSNVLIDEADQPRITDFGLAKRLSSDAQPSTFNHQLTQTGQVLGSPSFIPPEQAAGGKGATGPPSDVYSLGAILYHCLTARPPFVAETMTATLRMVAENEPVSPRLLNVSVPRDLETICLKCLEKDPKRRYATAQDLADELGRFLRGEAIHARAVRWAENFWRWCRRNPGIAGLAALVVLLLATVAIVSTVSAARLKRANREGQEHLRESLLAQAHANRWSGRLGRRFASLEVLKQAADIRPSIELRNEAIACLALPDLYPVRSFEIPEHHLIFDLNVAENIWTSVDPTGQVAMRRLTDGGILRKLTHISLPVNFGVLSPDGRYLAIGAGMEWYRATNKAPEVLLLDLTTSELTLQFTNLWARAAAFTPDNELLILAHKLEDGSLTLTAHDLRTKRVAYRTPLAALPYQMSISPAGNRLAITLWSREVPLLDARTGKPLLTLTHSNGTYGLDWHPTADLLATGDADGRIYLWDLSLDPPRADVLDHGAEATGVKFSPDGSILATTGWNDQLRLWDVRTRRELVRKPNFGGVSFEKLSNSLHVICRPGGKTVEVCTLADGRECAPLLLPKGVTGSRHCAFSPDGRLLASGHSDGIRLWDLGSGTECAFLPEGSTSSAEFDSVGRRLFTSGDGGFNVWDVERTETSSGILVRVSFREIHAEGYGIERASLDAAASRAGFPSDGWVEVVDLASGTRLLPKWRQDMIPDRLHSVALSPDGRWCAAPTWSGSQALLWEIDSDTPPRSLSVSGVNFAAFTRDSRLLITGSGDEYLARDTASWKERWRFSREKTGGAHARASLTPDGLLGAAAVSLTRVRLFDTRDGHELATLETTDSAESRWFAFSPDSGRLAVATAGPLLRVWNLHAIRRQLAEIKFELDLPPSPMPATNGWDKPLTVTTLRTRVPPRVSPRDPRCSSAQIDLTAYYNCTFKNFAIMTGDSGNDLAPLPVGLQAFAGTAFDVRGVIQLLGPKGYDGPTVRPEVTGIHVDRECRALNFLHSCLQAGTLGVTVGEYVVHYANGRAETIPLTTGDNIANWRQQAPEVPHLGMSTVVAWRGANAATQRMSNNIVLYKSRWENPHPDTSITTIDLRSALIGPAPFLIAITAE